MAVRGGFIKCYCLFARFSVLVMIGKIIRQINSLSSVYKDRKVKMWPRRTKLRMLRYEVAECPSWKGRCKRKKLQMQALREWDEENTTPQSKVENLRLKANRLQLESEAIFMLMEELHTLQNQREEVVNVVTALKDRKLETKAELRQNSKHPAVSKMREDAM